MDMNALAAHGLNHFLFLAQTAEAAPTVAPSAVAQASLNGYVHQALMHPFTWGLIVGLILVFLTWLSAMNKSRELRREVKRLREHLNTQMDITSRGNSAMKTELDALKSQNENLRVAVKEWQQKPGRNEMRMLAVYDRAIRILNQNAPGFSPVWERAVRESEEEIVAADSGMSAVLRRAFRPFSALGNGTPAKADKSAPSTYEETTGGSTPD